jgi:hypothetical protein
MNVISEESASTIQPYSFELSLHWVTFELSVELQNHEEESGPKSHELILHMAQQ